MAAQSVSEDLLLAFHKLHTSSFDETKATKVRKSELLSILKYLTSIPGILDLIPSPSAEKLAQDSASDQDNPTTPPATPASRPEAERVCSNTWKGLVCSNLSSCPRLHPELCKTNDCPGRDTCGLFHGRKKSPKPLNRDARGKKTTHKSSGNGPKGNRHPKKKTMLPHFATAREEEYYLRYRLATMERPRTYRDALVAPSPTQPSIPVPALPAQPLPTATPTPVVPSPTTVALPALAEAIQKAVLAALSATNLTGLSH